MEDEFKQKTQTEIVFNAGIVHERLAKLLEDDIFRDLSKHSEKWQSPHEKEDETLYQARCYLSYIEVTIYDVLGLLNPNE